MREWLEMSRGFPEQLAVGESVANSRTWSYLDLWKTVEAVRIELRRFPPPTAIAILAQRSPWAYASILACLAEGHFFVPINPKWPQARAQKVLAATGATVVLTESRYEEGAVQLSARSMNVQKTVPHEGVPAVIREFPGQDVAYILFTSGSTGEPKGIAVSRANLSAFLKAMNEILPVHRSDRFTQSYDLSFDLGIGEILWALTTGASLHPLEAAELPFIDKYFARAKPTIWSSTPSLVQFLISNKLLGGDSSDSVRRSLFCGERLLGRLASEWFKKNPKSEIYNFYGPTETTIYLTFHKWSPEELENVPIGQALPGAEVDVVDGELRISGPQVSLGYWRDPVTTTKAFVHKEGRIWYLTGDLVHRADDGNLVFIGRKDDQVKVRGHRVELGELEVVAARTGQMAVAAAIVGSDGGLDLILFVKGEFSREVQTQVKAELRKHLPSYAQPKEICFSKEWPLGLHGKLDKASLIAEYVRARTHGRST